MAKITYTDKVAINIDPSIPDINKCMAVDLNQIKKVVNMTLDTLKLGTDTWSSSGSYGINAIVVYENEVYENITGTSTTTNPSLDTTNWLKLTYDYFMGAVKQLPITALGGYNVYKCDIENINTGFYIVNGINNEVNLYEGNTLIYNINNFAIVGYTTLGQINIFMNGKVIACQKDNNVWKVTDLFKSYQKLIAVSSSAPSQCRKGDKYFNTSTNQIYEATATNTWSSTGNTPQTDIFYVVFDTDSMTIYAYNETTLVGVSSSGAGGESLPVGVSVAYMGTIAPQGYLMEDGTLKLISEYPELYNVLGHRYDLPTDTDNTKFRLPNKCGRVLVGLDSTQIEFDTLGETGGSKYLQAHTHNYANANGVYGGSVNNTWTGGGTQAGVVVNDTSSTTGGVSTITTGNSGNLQPYIVVNYIIKAHPSAVNTSEVVNEHSTSETDVYSCNYVNTELAKKQDYIQLSTNEYDTGKRDTDGSIIYGKFIDNITLSSGTAIQVNTGITNLKRLADLRGGFKMGTQSLTIPSYYGPSTFICANIDYKSSIQQYIILYDMAGLSGKAWFIIEYTKTTD